MIQTSKLSAFNCTAITITASTQPPDHNPVAFMVWYVLSPPTTLSIVFGVARIIFPYPISLFPTFFAVVGMACFISPIFLTLFAIVGMTYVMSS